ncbi:translation initiation factor IF-2 [Juglans microcarpa x Juglans regia]|uniref:translation initiation factor IF-2 n=1 Tax=Juglans microcarpa x Juglans regia TaxID=2249226 RepID=UPI001B7E260F|nr:translation initiation factor IF-2 [Juglans microcarpa x Juglans regia]
MPAPPDPRPGSAFIWLISSVLFLSIAAGGGCLVVYMLQPDSPYATWLPFVGVAFVCLPWLFWVLTCFYRLISRAFGFRVGVAPSGGGGGGGAYKGGAYAAGGAGAGGGGPNAANAANNKVAIDEAHAGSVEPPVRSSPESEARRRAQFEAILALDDQDGHGSSEDRTTDMKKTSSLSARLSRCNDSSVASHESEMPLASSMAS